MGGRGSGGGRGGKASAGGGGGSALNKDELVNLYNNISGNPSYTVDERVRAMSSIKKEIDKIEEKEKTAKEKKVKEKKKKELSPEEQKKLKAEELKKKRLAALEKARAKRAENLKNGIKPAPKKSRVTKAKMSMNSTVSDLKYNLLRNVKTDGYLRSSDFRVEDYGDVISVSIRDLGKWKNPSHARYEEDYDWQVLHQSSGKQIDKVVKKLQRQSGRKISWDAGEKNWISFDIEKKKGD